MFKILLFIHNNRFVKIGMGGDFLSSESKKMPEPKMTREGKYQCPEDDQVYDTKRDYEAHCKEAHKR